LTWEQVARIAVEVTGSKSQIMIHDADLPPAMPHYAVGAIERAFGLRLSAEDHPREHFRFLAGKV
jgi:hypothetical protein